MKMKLIIIIAIVLMFAVSFAVVFNQRQNDDIFMELVLWTDGGGVRGASAYTFVIENNGTMISSYGRSRSDSLDESRTHNFIRSIRERRTTTLSEGEFRYISELVNTTVMLERNPDLRMSAVNSQAVITLLHDGDVFRRIHTGEAFDLLNEVVRLSPLTIRW